MELEHPDGCRDDEKLICPACGYWEEPEGDLESGEWTCPECGRKVDVEVEFSRTIKSSLPYCDGGCKKSELEYLHRSVDKLAIEWPNGKLTWVNLPKEKWTIQDRWRCRVCGRMVFINSPYVETEDPLFTDGVIDKPYKELTNETY